MLGLVDRGSILLIVYTAFSDGVSHGIWHQVNATQMAIVLGLDAVLLAIVLLITNFGGQLLGFSRADRIAIMFCGSKKSLASGLPMASDAARRTVGRADRAAADAVSPDPADDMRGAGAALCRWRGRDVT